MGRKTKRAKTRGIPELKQRSNGYYYIYFNRRKSESLETQDPVTAQQLYQDALVRLREGKLVQLYKVERITLSEFTKDYLEMRQKQVVLGEIVEGTYNNDQKALKVLREVMGDIALRTINAARVKDFKARLLTIQATKGHDIRGTKGYINALMRSLRAAFSWALHSDPASGKQPYIETNPFADRKGYERVMFDLGKRLPRFHDDHDIQAVLTWARETVSKARATAANESRSEDERRRAAAQAEAWQRFGWLYRGYLFTGTRSNELLAIQWQDIDFGNNIIHVRHAKRNKERTVVLLHEMRAVLDEIGIRNIGKVFPWYKSTWVSKMFKQAARAAGVSEEKTLHGSRHAFGVTCVRCGVHIRVIQSMMGHSNLGTTEIYTTVADQMAVAEMRKFSYGNGTTGVAKRDMNVTKTSSEPG